MQTPKHLLDDAEFSGQLKLPGERELAQHFGKSTDLTVALSRPCVRRDTHSSTHCSEVDSRILRKCS